MKISLFTGVQGPNRQEMVENAVHFAATMGTTLFVLPGKPLGQESSDANFYKQLAIESKIAILAEVISSSKKIGNVTYCFRPEGSMDGPFVQHFATSAPTNADHQKVAQLIREFQTGERTVIFGSTQIGILLCGENNVLKNMNHNVARLRYDDLAWPYETYNVLINPSHTVMGEWGILHKRFKFFSAAGRCFLYCTNNTNKSKVWKSTLCIYKDGGHIFSGDMENVNGCMVHREMLWRIVTTDVS
jgi:hypothetical protein